MTHAHGLFIDSDVSLAVAQVLGDARYLCHIVPGFDRLWRGMMELPYGADQTYQDRIPGDTMSTYLEHMHGVQADYTASRVRQWLLVNSPACAQGLTPEALPGLIAEAHRAVQAGWRLDDLIRELENEDADAA